ncbi:MAG: D-aminoacylase [Fimbriimonadaceae bacterium]
MFLAIIAVAPTTLLTGGMIVDGRGADPYRADLRIKGEQIVAIGKLKPISGEVKINVSGLVVSPGFVDAHSHADGGIEKEPTALSQITQGITTAIVGQDGGWKMPLAQRPTLKAAINLAYFSGHGGIRAKVMGEDYKREATPAEIEKMKLLVEADMQAGALGLSTGLEYDPGYYSTTSELIELSRVAAKHGGMYISHMRDEGDNFGTALAELLSIGQQAQLPTQVSHIKLCTSGVWGEALGFLRKMPNSTTADIYPYLFWQSSMSALTPSREWAKREIWVKALRDVGGAKNVRLTSYSPEPKWVGKTIAELAAETRRDEIGLIQEILGKTRGQGGSGEESVAVTAMTEPDLIEFMKSPRTMFSSDGSIGGSHPRGAGSFPRVLGRYVRELKVLRLQEAVSKMTSLPCRVFKLQQRGQLKKGFIADITVFDPKMIKDVATASDPTRLSVGVKHVFVNGVLVLKKGIPTRLLGGRLLRRAEK